MSYDSLREAIVENIRPNGNQEITGQALQDALLGIIDEAEAADNLAAPKATTYTKTEVDNLVAGAGGGGTTPNWLEQNGDGKIYNRTHYPEIFTSQSVDITGLSAGNTLITGISRGSLVIITNKEDNLSTEFYPELGMTITLPLVGPSVTASVSGMSTSMVLLLSTPTYGISRVLEIKEGQVKKTLPDFYLSENIARTNEVRLTFDFYNNISASDQTGSENVDYDEARMAFSVSLDELHKILLQKDHLYINVLGSDGLPTVGVLDVQGDVVTESYSFTVEFADSVSVRRIEFDLDKDGGVMAFSYAYLTTTLLKQPQKDETLFYQKPTITLYPKSPTQFVDVTGGSISPMIREVIINIHHPYVDRYPNSQYHWVIMKRGKLRRRRNGKGVDIQINYPHYATNESWHFYKGVPIAGGGEGLVPFVTIMNDDTTTDLIDAIISKGVVRIYDEVDDNAFIGYYVGASIDHNQDGDVDILCKDPNQAAYMYDQLNAHYFIDDCRLYFNKYKKLSQTFGIALVIENPDWSGKTDQVWHNGKYRWLISDVAEFKLVINQGTKTDNYNIEYPFGISFK